MLIPNQNESNPIELTIGSSSYRKLVSQQFTTSHLHGEFSKLFDKWRCDSDNNYVYQDFVLKFSVELCIYDNKHSINYVYSMPKTVNDFIVIMNSLNVSLFWFEPQLKRLRPKEYLKKSRIEEYYRKLLEIMNKTEELL